MHIFETKKRDYVNALWDAASNYKYEHEFLERIVESNNKRIKNAREKCRECEISLLLKRRQIV